MTAGRVGHVDFDVTRRMAVPRSLAPDPAASLEDIIDRAVYHGAVAGITRRAMADVRDHRRIARPRADTTRIFPEE
jgi:hypothetical protein